MRELSEVGSNSGVLRLRHTAATIILGKGVPSLTVDPSPRNNLLAHPEVNANVDLALKPTHYDRLIAYDVLRAAQHPDGYWASYFYPSAMFAPLLALGVLQDRPAHAAAMRRGVDHLLRTIAPDGSWKLPQASGSSASRAMSCARTTSMAPT